MITSPALNFTSVRHGFFTRQGGHSAGLYASLNCGLGSGDDIAVVTKNRTLVAEQVEVDPSQLVSAFQIHSADVVEVSVAVAERPKADGLVTNTPGLALGILTADCGPVLFADEAAGVIGACHSGWKGALNGVTDTTIAAMEKLGAARSNIVAVLGPTISKANYEVSAEFIKPFLSQNAEHGKYFTSSLNKDHYMFDLPGYLIARMINFGVSSAVDLGLCTYADETRFFSYRRATHLKEADYGRMIAVITLGQK